MKNKKKFFKNYTDGDMETSDNQESEANKPNTFPKKFLDSNLIKQIKLMPKNLPQLQSPKMVKFTKIFYFLELNF